MLKKELLESKCSYRDMIGIIDDVKAASEIAIDLISDLLTQDKIEEGTMQLDRATVGLWHLIKESVQLFSNQVSFPCDAYMKYDSAY